MKSAAKQQKCKVHYLGTSVATRYIGSQMQPGHAGNRTGTRLSRKAAEGMLARRVGVVSKALDNIARAKR